MNNFGMQVYKRQRNGDVESEKNCAINKFLLYLSNLRNRGEAEAQSPTLNM